jgi:hypothetical protein
MPTVVLDTLPLRPLLDRGESLLAALEEYQRHASAAGFRVNMTAGVSWLAYQRSALQAEAELGRLGLSGHPQDFLAVEGGEADYRGVMGLREHLLAARGGDGRDWGERLPPTGWWSAVREGAAGLPDLRVPLATLREVVADLRAAAARREAPPPSPALPPTNRLQALPAADTADLPTTLPALLSAPDLARVIQQPESRVDTFLRRFRKTRKDCFVRIPARRRNEPQCLYRTSDVWPALQERLPSWERRTDG